MTAASPEAALPLSDLVVLDLTQARAGPTAVRQLADWGADVLRIERSGPGDQVATRRRHGHDYQNLHRNKRCMTLDLQHPRGRELFFELAGRSDVLVENFRPAVKHRLGVDYAAVREHNPRIVYASISGFGQTGPYRDRAGVDQIAQGMGGLMSVTGLPGQGPVRVGTAISDLAAGLYLACGILTALHERARTGVGRWVHTSLLEAQIGMLDFQAARYLVEGEVAGQAGNDHPTIAPMGVFPASDGQVNLAASSNRHFRALCGALDAPDLLEREDYSSVERRVAARERLQEDLAGVTRRFTCAELIERLNGAGIPCGPINRIDQTFADPQVRHLGIAAPVAPPGPRRYPSRRPAAAPRGHRLRDPLAGARAGAGHRSGPRRARPRYQDHRRAAR